MNDNFDIDIDKIFDQSNNIKPLTDGLGFHHSIKEEKKVSIKKQAKNLDSELKERARQLAQKKKSSFANNATMGDLSAFYQEEVKEKSSIPTIEISKSEELGLNNAKVGIDTRLIAFVVDLLFVTFINLSIFAISFTISGLPENVFLSAFFSQSFYIEGLLLYALIFIFYFSFFDKTSYSTLGKNLMGIKTTATKGKMSYYKSFIRSVFTLISFATCGAMNLLGITDLVSSSKISKS